MDNKWEPHDRIHWRFAGEPSGRVAAEDGNAFGRDGSGTVAGLHPHALVRAAAPGTGTGAGGEQAKNCEFTVQECHALPARTLFADKALRHGGAFVSIAPGRVENQALKQSS